MSTRGGQRHAAAVVRGRAGVARRAWAAALAAAAALLGGGALAAPARADFVHALGSPLAADGPRAGVDVADVDGNGHLDVVHAGPGDVEVTAHVGNGTGWMRFPRPYGFGGPVAALHGGDFDGDGRRDYALLVPGAPPQLRLQIAQAGGGFATETVLADAGAASDVAIANLDGAGTAELVVADGSELTVLSDDGGGWTAGAPVATGASGEVARIAAADFDGDGRLDVVAADGDGPSGVLLLRGDGAGGLAAAGRRATGLPGPPTSVAAGDMDGDGAVDLVAGGSGGRFAVLRGSGAGIAGAFAPAAGSPFGSGTPAAVPDDLAVADLNGDGQRDLVAADRAGRVLVLLNSATGIVEAIPAAVDFGALPAASPPTTRTLTFRSLRGRLEVTRIDLHGSSRLRVGADGCVGRTLLLGQACSLDVAYRPTRRARADRTLLSLDVNAAAVVVPLDAAVRAPLVDEAVVRPRRVRPGRRLALRYELSEAARLRLTVERGAVGRRVGRGGGARGNRRSATGRSVRNDGRVSGAAASGGGGRPRSRSAARCVPRRPGVRGRRCRIWTPLASFTRRGRAGPNRLRLRARVRGVRLEPGVYRYSLTAIDRFRNESEPAHATFRVRAPRRRAAAD